MTKEEAIELKFGDKLINLRSMPYYNNFDDTIPPGSLLVFRWFCDDGKLMTLFGGEAMEPLSPEELVKCGTCENCEFNPQKGILGKCYNPTMMDLCGFELHIIEPHIQSCTEWKLSEKWAKAHVERAKL